MKAVYLAIAVCFAAGCMTFERDPEKVKKYQDLWWAGFSNYPRMQ